ncbi:hypothetical protein [Marinifilum caeruleilacunae]|uniref:Outer membrane protein beta-barrel domain-containing protein n=1 Tax=Marinifilum caeruleilacunae TaxID=2499076 RepID=A0ABX1WXA6_9BACT|nr:hypothetical protein [Marinifilum caeruleilacunae]NOU60556.1 hypothetical protein [Marinifilum caeruleilacunae]
MIKPLTTILFLFLCLTLSAQEYRGKLIHQDGTSKEVSFLDPYSKSNYKEILYLHYGIAHELYAENFKRAEFSDDIVYESIEISTGEKAWARVHFESDIIALYQRYSSVYIKVDTKIIDISKRQTPSSFNIPNDLQKQWQSFLNKSNGLSFKKIKKLLIDYHKQKDLKYRRLFPNSVSKFNIEVGVGLAITSYNFIKSTDEQIDNQYFLPSINVGCRYILPRFLKNSFLNFSLSLQHLDIQKDTYENTTLKQVHYEYEIKSIQLAAQISLNKQVISFEDFKIYAKAGFLLYNNMGSDGTLNTEYVDGYIIRTQENSLQLAKKSGFIPLLALVVDKKIAKHQFSLSFQYEHFNESGKPSDEVSIIEFSKPMVKLGLAMKF